MSRIRPARFVHVVYRTRRFEQMIEWYRTVFDCNVQYQNPVLAFLTYDDEHHRVALINLSAVKPEADAGERRGTIGVDHVAYTYGSVEDLLRTTPAQGQGHRALRASTPGSACRSGRAICRCRQSAASRWSPFFRIVAVARTWIASPLDNDWATKLGLYFR